MDQKIRDTAVRSLAFLSVAFSLTASQVGYTELVFEDDSDAVQMRDEIRTDLSTEPTDVAEEADSIGVSIDSLPRATSDLLDSVQPKQKKLTQSDRIRRERIQQELNNEDMIQQKLEEARLKEEKERSERISKRAEALLGTGKAEADEEEAPVKKVAVEEKDSIVVEQAAPMPAIVASEMPETHETLLPVSITLKPRGGYTDVLNIRNVNVVGRYSFGVEAEAGVNDHFAVGIVYDYSRFGVNSPYFSASAWQPYLGSQDAMFLKQHYARAVAKAYVLNRDYRVRPFVGGSLGYRRSNLNYDESIQSYFSSQVGYQSAFQNLRINSLLAGAVVGADVQISKNIGVSLQFEYSQPMYSTVKGNRVYTGVVSPTSFTIADQDKEYVGRQIRNRGLWSIAGGVGFTF